MPTAARMYIVDARHFLDDKGAIAPSKGPARALAEFCAGLIAYATDFDSVGVPAPTCFRCRKSKVQAVIDDDDAVCRWCPRCATEGQISHWQGTLWDLSIDGEARG